MTIINDVVNSSDMDSLAVVGSMPQRLPDVQTSLEPASSAAADAAQMAILSGANGGCLIMESALTTIEPTLMAPHHPYSPILAYDIAGSCES